MRKRKHPSGGVKDEIISAAKRNDGVVFDFPPDLGTFKIESYIKKKMKQTLHPMVDSSPMIQTQDSDGMWARFQEDGYLLLRGLLSRGEVEAAKEGLQAGLVDMGLLSSDRSTALSKNGWTIDIKDGTVIAGQEDFASDEGLDAASTWKRSIDATTVPDVVSSPVIDSALHLLAKGKAAAEASCVQYQAFRPLYQWLRVKAPGECTPEHADIFYFKNYTTEVEARDRAAAHNTPSDTASASTSDATTAALSGMDTTVRRSKPTLGTTWIPLGDVSTSDGVLAIMRASCGMKGLDGKAMRGAQLPVGYFKNAVGGQWCVGPYCAGDVVVFDMNVIHCTSRNYNKGYRLSADFRWSIENRHGTDGSAATASAATTAATTATGANATAAIAGTADSAATAAIADDATATFSYPSSSLSPSSSPPPPPSPSPTLVYVSSAIKEAFIDLTDD